MDGSGKAVNLDGMTLVLGEMTGQASPKTHVAAGPWCFAGMERAFPDWEKSFLFAPEPLADSSMLPLAAKAAQSLCTKMIPNLAAILDAKSGEYPEIYWQTLLAPWAMDVSRQIVERWLRVRAMINQWGKFALIVPALAPDCSFNFRDEQDFSLRGGLGVVFNHWLFSRLLEQNWPAAWRKMELPAPPALPEDAADTDSQKSLLQNLRQIFRQKFRQTARDLQLNLPFPKLKGMTALQALLFSGALLHNCRKPDHSQDMQKSFYDPEILDRLDLDRDFLPIFLASLPQSVRKLRHSAVLAQKAAAKPRLRVASVLAYEDAPYRQKLAYWRARGNRLAFAQHGGNYGQVKVACDTEYVEYSQAAFFTWGWKKHGQCQGNFIPMPYPQLAAQANKWHGQAGGNLLFVGAEMAAYGYRLDSRPTPLQFVKYRQAKALFFEQLGQEWRQKTLYRPYFHLPGTLADAEWLLPRFPDLALCQGPLLPHLLNCSLLVLDHHGTVMLEAFAANAPVIMYWERSAWPLTEDCENLLNMLHKAGIWQPDAEAAAKKAREVLADPLAWRNSPEFQEARKKFCESQALIVKDNINRVWIDTLKQL